MPKPYGVTIVVAMTTKKDCVRELQAESAALSVNSAHLKAQVAELQHVKKAASALSSVPESSTIARITARENLNLKTF